MKKTRTKPEGFDHAAVARTVSTDLDGLLGPAEAASQPQPVIALPAPEPEHLISPSSLSPETLAKAHVSGAVEPGLRTALDLPRIAAIFVAGFLGMAAGYGLSHAGHEPTQTAAQPAPVQAVPLPQENRG